MPKLSVNLKEILSRVHVNFEEENRVLKTFMVIINYYITINAYYNCNCIINAWYNYYISNKGLLDECDKEDNLEVTGGVTSCFKRP